MTGNASEICKLCGESIAICGAPQTFIPLTTTKGETYFLRASLITGVDPYTFAEDHLDCPGHKGAAMAYILNGEVKVTGCKETPAQVADLLNGTAQ